VISGGRPCLAARLSRRVGGVPRALGSPSWSLGLFLLVSWPGKKDKGERTADERWALIRAAMEDQASGAMHVDPGTKDYKYTRAEVETLIAMTAALLCIVPALAGGRELPGEVFTFSPELGKRGPGGGPPTD
jgi:hypothetical protein